ncbi:HEAT repeat domain-containing protein [Natronococcus sp. JC468]|uniref:HEAT repeat domain-containing protein n=1 Tax=Natronococcus sp. JC468 TaxID=1961921 RepID=UPI00143C88F3|nr:HEAT repeat domain-containing protein [Natronococcus sp. JC468]NKE36103.1 HEAT repeat domain-containing protein [Natronococcus sp. JC468]
MISSGEDATDRARELRDTAAADPERVPLGDVVELLVLGDPETRRLAMACLETALEARPEATDAAVTAFERLLADDDAHVRRRAALSAGAAIQGTDAASFEGLVPALEPIGDDPAEPGRDAAIRALAAIALERPESATGATDPLLEVCHARVVPAEPAADALPGAPSPVGPERDRRSATRVQAVAGLTRIAAERPAVLVDGAERVAALLEDDHHLVRSGACEVLESLAERDPAAVEPFVPALVDRLVSDTDHPVPWRAADALNAVGGAYPERVGTALEPAVDDVGALLERRDPGIRGVGIGLLNYVAQVDPASVEGLLPCVRELLASNHAPVRANAALTLGLAGCEGAVDDLESLAADDPDGAVRDAAARALDRLEDDPSRADRPMDNR